MFIEIWIDGIIDKRECSIISAEFFNEIEFKIES